MPQMKRKWDSDEHDADYFRVLEKKRWNLTTGVIVGQSHHGNLKIMLLFKPLTTSVPHNIETSHLVCSSN